jgi:hypothetical protein
LNTLYLSQINRNEYVYVVEYFVLSHINRK